MTDFDEIRSALKLAREFVTTISGSDTELCRVLRRAELKLDLVQNEAKKGKEDGT